MSQFLFIRGMKNTVQAFKLYKISLQGVGGIFLQIEKLRQNASLLLDPFITERIEDRSWDTYS